MQCNSSVLHTTDITLLIFKAIAFRFHLSRQREDSSDSHHSLRHLLLAYRNAEHGAPSILDIFRLLQNNDRQEKPLAFSQCASSLPGGCIDPVAVDYILSALTAIEPLDGSLLLSSTAFENLIPESTYKCISAQVFCFSSMSTGMLPVHFSDFTTTEERRWALVVWIRLSDTT